MSDHHDPDERQSEIKTVVLKFIGVVVALGVLIWIGTSVVVNSLDLDEVSTGPVGSADYGKVPELPRTALPTGPTASPTPTPSPTPTDDFLFPTDIPTSTEPPYTPGVGSDGLTLTASSTTVRAGTMFRLLGEWPGKDQVSLKVQRFEDGDWVDFGVSTQVDIGTFDVDLLTSREGAQRFRVYDPVSDTASNDVTVTIS